jgi:hypothetical protein
MKLERVFDHFPKYHVKIARRFQCKSRREYISKKHSGMRVYTKLNVNVNLSLDYFLTEHHAMKAYWGVKV